MGIDLKPCPFCGGEAEFTELGQCLTAWVECKSCGAFVNALTDSGAKSAWNTRHEATKPKGQAVLGQQPIANAVIVNRTLIGCYIKGGEIHEAAIDSSSLIDCKYKPKPSAQQPVGWSLSSDKINELQQASIGRLVKRCKQAHFVDVRLRINGNYEYEQADWIKHMLPASTPQVSVECREMFEAWHVNFYGKPVTPNVKETAPYKIWQAAWDARAPERESGWQPIETCPAKPNHCYLVAWPVAEIYGDERTENWMFGAYTIRGGKWCNVFSDASDYHIEPEWWMDLRAPNEAPLYKIEGGE